MPRLDELRGMLPSACHAVDLPLTDQLAIVAGCDVLISSALRVRHGRPGRGHALAEHRRQPVAGVLLQLSHRRRALKRLLRAAGPVTRFPAYDAVEARSSALDDGGPTAPSMRIRTGSIN